MPFIYVLGDTLIIVSGGGKLEHRLSCSCGSEWVLFVKDTKEQDQFIEDFFEKHKDCALIVSQITGEKDNDQI